jgi:cytochrome P450 PksS
MSTAVQAQIHLGEIVLSDPLLKANPYPVYSLLRAEVPVCRARFAPGGVFAWLITRFDDVVSVLRNPQIANDRRSVPDYNPPFRMRVLYRIFGPVVDNMLGSDEPDHTRLRNLVHKAFTQKRVEELRSRIESLTNELADAAFQDHHRWDIVNDYAVPIPTTIIAEMLGVPASDRLRFKKWSDSLLLASATRWSGMARNVPRFLAFLHYIRTLVQEARRNPKDDLISALVQAEEAGDKLSEDELVSMIFLLLIAGYETTVNLIGNGMLALLENPAQYEKLHHSPSLVPLAVEEFLRYYTPIDYAQARAARTSITIRGVNIRAGDSIVACISSANRDEACFKNPEVLDIARDPNRHIAFGQGLHFCLGAFLARLEAQIAFTTLMRRFPQFEFAEHQRNLQWRKSMLMRGLEALPVRQPKPLSLVSQIS